MISYQMINPKPYLYHFRDSQGTCFSIIKGEKLSLVVDSGYGIGNIKECVEKYITTPYKVVATHGHMDHTGGFFQFKEAYVPIKDLELYEEHNSLKRRKLNLEDAQTKGLIDDTFDKEAYINAKCNKIIPLRIDEVFDLGNYHVRVINMEGHTKGSIGLLIEEERFLLTGDAAISMIWLFLKESTNISTYTQMLKRVKELPFDDFITGHIMRVFDKKYFDYYLDVAEHANPANSIKVTFKNFERDNTYQYQQQFGSDIIGICYQEPKED